MNIKIYLVEYSCKNLKHDIFSYISVFYLLNDCFETKNNNHKTPTVPSRPYLYIMNTFL